jgi:alanine racemase
VIATPTTYVAVDLSAIRHNAAEVLARLKPGARLCAVVKANAYGHGAPAVAAACLEAGAEWLAVSTVAEGVALREAGLSASVLVFMPALAQETATLVEHYLTATVTSTQQVMELQREGERQGKVARAQVYEDLGLGRLGPEEPVLDIVEAAEPWPNLEITGIYTHFGPPGSGVNLDVFEVLRRGGGLKVYASLLFEGLRRVTERRLMFHAAASSLFLEEPEHQFDMVRIGTLLYGQYPDHVGEKLGTLDLRNTFELRSHIVSAHTVERGGKVGYGGEFVCARETRVATVPVGLAHGLGVASESLGGRLRSAAKGFLRARDARRGRSRLLPQAIIGGRVAPIIGRISMDQCCLDITDIPDAGRGTEVVLPARRVTTSAAIPRVYSPPMD